MIIKFTLMGLLTLFIVVIALSYYSNKEGFENITNTANTVSPSTNLSSAISGVTGTVAPTVTTSAPAPAPSPPPAPAASCPQTLHTAGSTIPERTDIKPEVKLSDVGYDAMMLQQKADLLKDIQKVVRNELLANRSTEPVISSGKTTQVSDSIAQGKEYEDSCYKDTEYRCPKNPDGSCPPLPDMTKYIKKDEIPCWGCSLDY